MARKKATVEVILDLLVTLFIIAMSVYGLATMLPYLVPLAKTMVTSPGPATSPSVSVDRVGDSDNGVVR